MTTIFAIGGEGIGPLLVDGTVKKVTVEAVHKKIIASTGKTNPKVLYIPTAKNDREDYIEGFLHYYKQLGCNDISVLRLITEKPSRKEIQAKISSADIIYVNGGNSHRMMALWRRNGVDKMLKRAYRQGVVMAGHSAGSLCWFRFGCSNSFEKKQPFRLSALGIIDALLCPHFDTEPVRQIALQKIMKRTPRLVAITLDEYAALEIVDSTYRIVACSPSAKARKTYWKRGEYIVRDIESTTSYQSLQQLLEKN